MIKLRVDWHQACESCGTEVVVDFLDGSTTECSCPWCGAAVAIAVGDEDAEARQRLAAAVRELEERMNAEAGFVTKARDDEDTKESCNHGNTEGQKHEMGYRTTETLKDQ